MRPSLAGTRDSTLALFTKYLVCARNEGKTRTHPHRIPHTVIYRSVAHPSHPSSRLSFSVASGELSVLDTVQDLTIGFQLLSAGETTATVDHLVVGHKLAT